jgi:hypothetical protein
MTTWSDHVNVCMWHGHNQPWRKLGWSGAATVLNTKELKKRHGDNPRAFGFVGDWHMLLLGRLPEGGEARGRAPT